jgi:hypothetical protein
MVVALAAAVPSRTARDPLIGAWSGSAWFQGSRLDFGVRFQREAGALKATMSSPDLLLLDQPLVAVTGDGGQVRFTTPDESPLHFEGALVGDSLRGTASVPAVPRVVNKGSAPLVFALGHSAPPTTPPYTTKEVSFANGAVRLAGTLFVP